MDKTEELKKYLNLEKKLYEIREKNSGAESKEEEELLEEMDDAWWGMTEEERASFG